MELGRTEAALQASDAKVEQTKKEYITKQEQIATFKAKMQQALEGAYYQQFVVESPGIDETNFENFVQPKSVYHKTWLRLKSKKDALEDCFMQTKRAFEDKLISLAELIEAIRKIATKQFLCIYKLQALQQKFLILQTHLS